MREKSKEILKSEDSKNKTKEEIKIKIDAIIGLLLLKGKIQKK